MTSEEFVACLRREVVLANVELYRRALERSLTEVESKDPYWRQTTELYRGLNEEQRDRFLAVLRQVVVDSVSNVLGILDGSSLLEQFRGEFHLTYDNSSTDVNGDLQSIFLAVEGR